MKRNGRVLKVLAALLAVGLLAAACGGGAEPTATPQPTPTKAPTATSPGVATPTATPAPPTPTPVPAVKRGGILRLGGNDPASLDPSKIEIFTISFTLDNIWSNIVAYRADSWTDTTIIGDLAERWEVSDGGKTFTFHLDPNARWQNIPPANGRALTSADVKWTLDLFLDPKYGSTIRGRIPSITSVEAPDSATLVIRLKSPAVNFLDQIAWSTVKILAREVLERDGSFEKTVVGSGPFLFDRWERGSRVRLRANPSFWKSGVDGKPLPYLDGLDRLIIPDPQTQTAAYRTGLLDSPYLTGGVDKAAAAQLKGTPGLTLTRGHNVFIYAMKFNHTVKPFDDVRVRRALLKGMDIYFIMKNVLDSADRPLESFVYSLGSDVDYPPEKLQKLFTRDVAGARKLLADAGLPNGFKVEMLIGAAGESAALQQQWKELGVDVTLAAPDTATYGQRRQKSAFELCYCSLNLQAEPLAMLIPQWGTGGSRNFGKYSNPTVDAKLEDALATLDRAKLRQKLEEIQDIMWEDVADIPVSSGATFLLQRDWVKGWTTQWAWGNQGLEFAWLDK